MELVFMRSGHSYLPCNRSFGSIEKVSRKTEYIPNSQVYADIIAISIKREFPVVRMKREEFMDVKKKLVQYVTNRHVPGFSRVCQLVVTVHYPEGYIVKNDYAWQDIPGNIIKIRLMPGRGPWSRARFYLSEVSSLTCQRWPVSQSTQWQTAHTAKVQGPGIPSMPPRNSLLYVAARCAWWTTQTLGGRWPIPGVIPRGRWWHRPWYRLGLPASKLVNTTFCLPRWRLGSLMDYGMKQ